VRRRSIIGRDAEGGGLTCAYVVMFRGITGMRITGYGFKERIKAIKSVKSSVVAELGSDGVSNFKLGVGWWGRSAQRQACTACRFIYALDVVEPNSHCPSAWKIEKTCIE
jgi:hypothetical protein